jgi:general secretion pathway protein C
MADKWSLRAVTLAVWALAAWSAGYWTLQFVGSGAVTASTPAPQPAAVPNSEPAQMARVFGPGVDKPAEVTAAPIAVDPGLRFALVGVVASRASTGVALLSVEGKPARPYRVGSTIDDGYTLKSVTARSATLATTQTGVSFTVNLAAVPASPANAGAPTGFGVPGLPASPASAATAPRVGPGTPLPMTRRSS